MQARVARPIATAKTTPPSSSTPFDSHGRRRQRGGQIRSGGSARANLAAIARPAQGPPWPLADGSPLRYFTTGGPGDMPLPPSETEPAPTNRKAPTSPDAHRTHPASLITPVVGSSPT